jgi:hypothetical protein
VHSNRTVCIVIPENVVVKLNSRKKSVHGNRTVCIGITNHSNSKNTVRWDSFEMDVYRTEQMLWLS